MLTGNNCPSCGSILECAGGESAHPSNWFCANMDCPGKKGQTSVEDSGLSCDYYVVSVEFPMHGKKPYTAEYIDISEALELTPHESNILKEIWRGAAARQGRKKKGNTALRGAEKLSFIANRILEVEKFRCK